MTATTTATTAAGRGEGPSREILVLAGVIILGTIMTVLDLTVVNVAIPAARRGDHRRGQLAVGLPDQPAGGSGRRGGGGQGAVAAAKAA
jgi:hypothetical protein